MAVQTAFLLTLTYFVDDADENHFFYNSEIFPDYSVDDHHVLWFHFFDTLKLGTLRKSYSTLQP